MQPKGWLVVLFVVVASPAAFSSIVSTILNPTGCSGISGALNKLLSPDSFFADAFSASVNFFNSTVICTKARDSEVAKIVKTLKLYLFYGPNITDCQIEPLVNASKLLSGGHWNASRRNVIFFTGWLKSTTSDGYSTEVIKAYHANGTYNLFLLDWDDGNAQLYTESVALLPGIAPKVAEALNSMAAADSAFLTLEMVGHSLGAHLAGYIARSLSFQVRYLVALDPAGPLFYPTMWQCQKGVTAQSALHVTAVHSDWNRFGGNMNVGQVDIFPNGGTFTQPGCTEYDTNPNTCATQFLCDHVRSLLFWCSAVKYPGTLLGRKCESSSAFAGGDCEGNPVRDITDPYSDPGMYYLNTNAAEQFGRGLEGI